MLNKEYETINIFPLNNYNQEITAWLNPKDINYDTPLMSNFIQQAHFEKFFAHYFGEYSPWNQEHVTHFLLQPPPKDLKTTEQDIIKNYSNENKEADQIGYNENFRPHTKG